MSVIPRAHTSWPMVMRFALTAPRAAVIHVTLIAMAALFVKIKYLWYNKDV